MTDYNFSKKKARDKTVCPFINTLLNEKLITDTNISSKDFVGAIKSLNILDSASLFLIEHALISKFTNTDNIIKSIQDVNEHGIIEHDISISRLDLF